MTTKLTIQHKRSSVAGNQPLPANLAVGELAINFADQKLYTKTGAGVIIPLGGGSKWTDETGGISRADMIKVGSAGAPLAEVDVDGTAAHNVVASTGAMDLSVGQMFTATASGALTWSFAGVPAGRGVTAVLHLTNGGVGAQTWPASVKWPGGTAPTLTSAGTDVIVFVTHDGGTTWRGNIFGRDIK